MELIYTLLGAVLSILTTIVIEYYRRPSLQLKIIDGRDANYKNHPAQKARFLYLEITNRPLPKIFRWLSRNAALQCHGTITFHHLDGQNVFGRSMLIRWTNLPNPVPASLTVGNTTYSLFDPEKLNHNSRVDVNPGETEIFNIASRFDDEEECYGWSNESLYKEPLWRNPDWRLSRNRYLVKVTVISSGEKCVRIFRLINDTGMNDFRLEPAHPGDKVID